MKTKLKQLRGYNIFNKIENLEYLLDNLPKGKVLGYMRNPSAPAGWLTPYYTDLRYMTKNQAEIEDSICEDAFRLGGARRMFGYYTKKDLESSLKRLNKEKVKE